MENIVYIYVLEDPITKNIRYVGKTKNPKMRFHNHCNKQHNVKSHKRNWINSLKNKGLKPIMSIIDEVSENDWHFWEKYWILQLKIWGCDLTNHTSGGDGLTMGNETSFKKGHTSKHDTNTFINCKQCNILFKISPSELKYNKQFCTKKCHSTFKKGKNFTNKGSFKKGYAPKNKGKKYITGKARTVLQYDLQGTFIQKFYSCKQASEFINCGEENIRRNCVGLSKTAKNYIWKYEQ